MSTKPKQSKRPFVSETLEAMGYHPIDPRNDDRIKTDVRAGTGVLSV